MEIVQFLVSSFGLSSFVALLVFGLGCFFKDAIFNHIANKMNAELEEKRASLYHKVQTQLEKEKGEIQEKLNEQQHQMQLILKNQESANTLLNTKFNLVKQEQIESYKEVYGKLLKVFHRLEYLLHYECYIKMGDDFDGYIIKVISKLDLPNTIKTKIIKAIEDKDENAIELLNYEEQMKRIRAFKEDLKDYKKCFNENDIFFTENISELMESLSKRMQITVDYIYNYLITNDVRMTNIKFNEMYKVNYDFEGKKKIIASLKGGLDEVKVAIRNEIDKV